MKSAVKSGSDSMLSWQMNQLFESFCRTSSPRSFACIDGVRSRRRGTVLFVSAGFSESSVETSVVRRGSPRR